MLPEEKIVTLLKNKKLKIAVAESCTGGLISKRITDIPGASDVLDMGIVSYANSIKARFLGVSEEILQLVRYRNKLQQRWQKEFARLQMRI